MDTGNPVPPLGLHPEPTLSTDTWTPGTRLLLHTDGTTEGRDHNGQFFELTSAACALGHGTLDQALDHLISALTTHVGHDLTDDVALVLAEYRTDAAARPAEARDTPRAPAGPPRPGPPRWCGPGPL